MTRRLQFLVRKLELLRSLIRSRITAPCARATLEPLGCPLPVPCPALHRQVSVRQQMCREVMAEGMAGTRLARLLKQLGLGAIRGGAVRDGWHDRALRENWDQCTSLPATLSRANRMFTTRRRHGRGGLSRPLHHWWQVVSFSTCLRRGATGQAGGVLGTTALEVVVLEDLDPGAVQGPATRLFARSVVAHDVDVAHVLVGELAGDGCVIRHRE